MTRAAALAVGLAAAACGRRAPLTSCDGDLGGVYIAGDRRWMIVDDGPTLEAYPLFPDADGPPDLVAAPRKIELDRPAARPAAPNRELTGALRRRYMRRAQRCDAHLPVHVTRCAGDTLDVVLADPAPPIELSPCTWPGPGPSRLERWRRE